MRSEGARAWGLCGTLVLAVGVLYSPVLDHGFLDYDDGLYVTDSEHVQAGMTSDTALWALTSLEVANWHPLTWWSHAITVEWFGLDPAAHHAMSVVLHAAVSAALLATLFAATGSLPRSALVAALFALHPMRVESVAWVAERKDVLFGLFYVLAIAAHTAWARRPTPWRYALVLAAGSAALMSKAMAVTLPFVLLLFDRWPLQRERPLSQRVVEKLPLFILCALTGVFAVQAQETGGALAQIENWPWSSRIANALVGYAAYLRSSFWPTELAVFYPHPPGGYGVVAAVSAGVVVIALASWGCVQLWRRPPIGVGLLWFLGTLVPVIGLVTVGEQSRADRYSYLPSIGLAIAVVWALPDAWLRRRASWVALFALLGALAATTWNLLPDWRDDETLFARALEVTRDSRVAHLNYGNAIEGDDRRAEQRHHFERAVELGPGYALGYYNLGRVLAKTGEFESAVRQYRRALALEPEDARIWNNLGTALSDLGKEELAESAYRQALEVAPDHPTSLFNLSILLLGHGELEEGVSLGWRYLEIRPADVSSRVRFASSLVDRRDPDRAIEALKAAPALDAAGYGLLAGLEWARGAESDAIAAAEQAAALAPDLVIVRNDLAWMLATCRNDALRDPVRALELARVAAAGEAQRRDPDVLDTLAAAQAAAGAFDAAEDTIATALERAREGGRLDLIARLEQRAALYRARRPYRNEVPGGEGAGS